MPDINPQTGEPQNPAGWSQDDPAAAGAGAPSLTSVLSSQAKQYGGKMDELTADMEKQYAAKEAVESPYRDKLLQVLESPNAAHAHLEKAANAPKPEDYKKNSMEFASAMALMGAVAGRFTRNAGNASLNAFAGALKGWQQGNQQAYENAAKEWEQNTKKTLENNALELQKYKEIMEDKKLNIDQMMAAMNIVGAQYQNKIMFDSTVAKNYTMSFGLVDKMEAIQARLQTSVDKMTELKKNQDEKNQTNAKWLSSPQGELWISQQPVPEQAKYQAFAQQYGAGRPRSGASAAVQQFIQEQRAAGHEPTSEEVTHFMAHYGAEVSGTRAFATGPQGNAVRSFNVSIDHLATMDDLITALHTGNQQTLNRLQNTLRTEFGAGAVPSFNFAKEVVGDEITKSILGSNIGSQADRLALKTQLDAARSPEQLREVISTAKKLMAGQLSGYRRQYETSTGGSAQDFDALLSDRAKQELGGLEVGGAAPAGPGGTTSSGVQWRIDPGPRSEIQGGSTMSDVAPIGGAGSKLAMSSPLEIERESPYAEGEKLGGRAGYPSAGPGKATPIHSNELSAAEARRYQRRIENADSDQELMKIQKELEGRGIDTTIIPAFQGLQ